jgi:hypothetical protein
MVAIAAVVACTGDSSTTDSTADAGHDSGPGIDSGGQNTVDGSTFDAGSGNTVDGSTFDAGPPPPSPPSSLGGRLVFWFSADKGYDTDGGSAIWKDQSPAGNDAVQALPIAIPPLFDGGTGVNGHPALHFSGAQFLQMADNASLQWAQSDFSVFMVERHTNSEQLYALLYAKWTDTGVFPGFFLWANYPTTNGPVTRLDTLNVVYGPDAGNDGVARVVGARKNAADLQLYSAGVLVGEKADASVTDNAGFNAATIPAYIGGRPQGIQMLQGDIAEVIGVKGTLTDPELANLQAYLKKKYGL